MAVCLYRRDSLEVLRHGTGLGQRRKALFNANPKLALLPPGVYAGVSAPVSAGSFLARQPCPASLFIAEALTSWLAEVLSICRQVIVTKLLELEQRGCRNVD